jgi:hypothetical protein
VLTERQAYPGLDRLDPCLNDGFQHLPDDLSVILMHEIEEAAPYEVFALDM